MKVNNGAPPPFVPADNQPEVRQVSSTQQLPAEGRRLASPGAGAQAHTPPPVSPNLFPASPQWPPEEFDPGYAPLEGLSWATQSHTPPPISPNRSTASPQWPSEEFDPDYASPDGLGWTSRFPGARSQASPDTLPPPDLPRRLPHGIVESATGGDRQRYVQIPPHHAWMVTPDSRGRTDVSSRSHKIADYARIHPSETDEQIAGRFGVARTTVNNIRRVFGVRGIRGHGYPLPDPARREIADYARIHTDESDRQIAARFGVSQTTIRDIRRVFDLQRTGARRLTLPNARRCEVALYARAHLSESDRMIGERFGIAQTTVFNIRRIFGVPRASSANVVRSASGSLQPPRSPQADPGNPLIQRFLQQLQSLPARPVAIPRGDRWASLPAQIRRDVYGNDRPRFEREATQAATERDRIDWALAQSGLRVVRNDGDHNGCLLISLLQHATGDYSRNHLTRADAIRNQLIAERLIRLNEPMLFTGPETRRAVEIINGNAAVTSALRVYSISDVAGTIAVDRIASRYRNSRDVLIWDQGGHFEAIARQ